MLLQKLAEYARGANANHTHIPPTVPVLSHFIPKKNYSDCGKEFLIASYIPNKFNGSAPEPTSSDVHIKSFPSYKAYVRQFGGVGLHWSVLHETFALAKALERNKVSAIVLHVACASACGIAHDYLMHASHIYAAAIATALTGIADCKRAGI